MRVTRCFGLVLLFAVGAAGCNENGVVGLPGDISASPDNVEYGRVEENTQFGQTVVISNVGDNAIEVRSIVASNPAFVLDEAAMPSAESPWVLRAGDFRPVVISFAPTALGDMTGELHIESNDGDEPELIIPLEGHAYRWQTDNFEQGGTIGGKADILFVVDNSGSMSEEQTKLGNSFSTFINWLTNGLVDYRVAITTTDMDDPNHQGKFQGNPTVISNTTPNVVDTFKNNVNVGANGSGSEKGIVAAATALSSGLLSSANAGFLRNDARLFVVWVTDEEDSSPSSPSTYQNEIVAAKGGDPAQVFFAAIAGPEPLGCFTFAGSADAGARYLDIVQPTGGLFGSICDADFGYTLQNLAFEVTSAGGAYPLSALPDPSTIVVTVDGLTQILAVDYMYDATSNVVTFQEGHVPPGGAAVLITYETL